jgi:FkbM family methyltransferase
MFVHSLGKLAPSHKRTLRDLGRVLGLEIRLSAMNAREDLRLVHFLKLQNIDMVLDVGANTGQFGTELFKAGYRGRLISFEALPGAHQVIESKARQSKYDWCVAQCCALSDTDGMASFNVTLADTSSSLLEPSPDFVQGTKGKVGVVRRIEVPTKRLDSFASLFTESKSPIFLKMDVQGAEAMVLRGATGIIDKIGGILTEMSFLGLYESQTQGAELHQMIRNLGFELWDINPGYRDLRTFRLGQVDAIYFRAQ